MLTAEEARELFSYDPATGFLTYAVTLGRRVVKGRRAGRDRRGGYRLVEVKGRDYYEHRLIWLIVHGRWPKDQIDHINGDDRDNRLCNLRECTSAENNQNHKRKKNKTGLTGVRKAKGCEARWVARISHNSRKIYLGIFGSPEEAYTAYVKAKAELHSFQPTIPDR